MSIQLKKQLSVLTDKLKNLDIENKKLREQIKQAKNKKEQRMLYFEIEVDNVPSYCKCTGHGEEWEECIYCFERAAQRMGCNEYQCDECN